MTFKKEVLEINMWNKKNRYTSENKKESKFWISNKNTIYPKFRYNKIKQERIQIVEIDQNLNPWYPQFQIWYQNPKLWYIIQTRGKWKINQTYLYVLNS